MRTRNSVEARLALLRIAIHQRLLKFVEHSRIEHGDLPVFQPRGYLAGLEQPLDFGSRKALASRTRQFDLQIEPVFAGTANIQLWLNPLDVLRHMTEAGADGDIPLALQSRQVPREE